MAAQSNILPGMELKSVAGIETPDWDSVRMALIGEIGDAKTTVGVAPFGSSQVVEKQLDLDAWHFDPENRILSWRWGLFLVAHG